MFDKAAERSIERATESAKERRHEYVCLEHLLFAIIETEDGAKLLGDLGAQIGALKEKLERFFHDKLDTVPPRRRYEPSHTVAFQRAVENAIVHIEFSSASKLTVGDLLASILNESDSHAAFFLNEQGVTRLKVLEHISHGARATEEPLSGGALGGDSEDGPQQTPQQLLKQYTQDLNQKARDGRVDPLIGRESEIERAIQVLARRNKNNPLFVGDQGVGKTHLVEGIAQRIVDAPAHRSGPQSHALE